MPVDRRLLIRSDAYVEERVTAVGREDRLAPRVRVDRPVIGDAVDAGLEGIDGNRRLRGERYVRIGSHGDLPVAAMFTTVAV